MAAGSGLRVLHVIAHLRAGGAAGSVVATARAAGGRHRVLALEPTVSPLIRLQLARAAIPILAPDREAAALADADVVLLNFWNTPATLAFLERLPSGLPVVGWLKTCGSAPPQLVPPALIERADRIVLTAAATAGRAPLAGHPALLAPPETVRGVVDLEPFADLQPVPHAGFVVTYVGTIGPGKIHPDFVRLSLAGAPPEARFVVCGAGGGEAALLQAAEAAGARDRFHLPGFVGDLRPVLAASDVFGYPLAPDTYSSSDRSLQEAMRAGLPPVILRHGGIVDMVEHGRTGLVVDERDYGAALAALAADPDLRRRLGRAAADHARVQFDSAAAARRIEGILQAAAASPGRDRAGPPRDDPFPAARRFAAALGEWGTPFRESLAGSAAADRAVMRLAGDWVRVEGGLFHHRNGTPDDGMLRHWTGLVLAAEGRDAAAAAEFAAAAAAGVVRGDGRARTAELS
ncbi:glycosyltransferase family 4 protein [Stella sp.]|uniref:glycosyltransferase family 4 protein n=1 Tax=Stella sp. TaxID=2912054 RepID=UPI0035ADBE49